MIRILLIENEIADIESFREELGFACQRADLTVARSRDSAVASIRNSTFDVVVCDLRIPSSDGALDDNEVFGLEVLQEARLVQSAAPILILSGWASMDNVGAIVNRPELDIWGSGLYPMVQNTPKSDYGVCMRQLQHIEANVDALNAIAVDDFAATRTDDMFGIRAFARSKGAPRVEIYTIAPGKSGAATVRISLLDVAGLEVGVVFAKLDSNGSTSDEHARYRKFVAGVMPPGSFAPVIDRRVAPGLRAPLIYSLIDGVPRSLYAILESDEAHATALVSELQLLEEACWLKGGQSADVSIAAIRRGRRVADEVLQRSIASDAWRAYEDRVVPVTIAPQHGDLHGENVLIDSKGRLFLVDFASAELAVSCLDAVVLELGFFAHPSARAIADGWPTVANLQQWENLDEYLIGCPFPTFVTAVRGWAIAAARSSPALRATAYAHAARQLRFDDVQKSLPCALIDGLVAAAD